MELITSERIIEGRMFDLTGFQRDLLYVIAGQQEPHGLAVTLFGRLAELAEYVDGDAIHETVDRCPSKIQ
jgi:hypothetical protein